MRKTVRNLGWIMMIVGIAAGCMPLYSIIQRWILLGKKQSLFHMILRTPGRDYNTVRYSALALVIGLILVLVSLLIKSGASRTSEKANAPAAVKKEASQNGSPAPSPTSRPAAKPAASPHKTSGTFAPYHGTGVCDVCNQGLNGKQAWVVPNDVFYSSEKYRQWHRKHMAIFGMSPIQADAALQQMQRMDNSPGSAVCEDCIHMFR